MIPMIMPAGNMDTGKSPKISVAKVENGYIVVYEPGKVEDEAENFGLQLVEGLLPMMMMSKEQGRAAARGVDEELDAWKKDLLEDKDDEDIDRMIERLNRMKDKLKLNRKDSGGTQIHVFNHYEEMMAFVAEAMKR
jgi:hypothetical protein